MSKGERKTLVIENRLSELANVERWLADLSEQWALPLRAAYMVDLIVNEGVTNVISYAWGDQEPHELSVSLCREGDSVIVEFEDDGVAFDPLASRPVVAGGDLESATVGGRGIQLMKSYSSEQHYEYDAPFNRLRLVVQFES